ncbi:MAG TPA: hypothetical protein VF495_22735 [Phenylobacterium sp.]
MVATSREEALFAARKLLRGFSGAPDPRKHARRLFGELTRAAGWTPAEEAEIIALGIWLQRRPAQEMLKAHCAIVLERLA